MSGHCEQSLQIKALRFAREKEPKLADVVLNQDELLNLALEWIDQGKTDDANTLFLYLSQEGCISAFTVTGDYFMEQGDTDSALKYYKLALEEEDGRAALKAAFIWLDQKKYPQAVWASHKAAILPNVERPLTKEDTNTTAQAENAHDYASGQTYLLPRNLSLKDRRLLFEYGALTPLPKEIIDQWRVGFLSLWERAGNLDRHDLRDCAEILDDMLQAEDALDMYSELQMYILLQLMLDVSVPLSKTNETYIGIVAEYAEDLMDNSFCYRQYNPTGKRGTMENCFLNAIDLALEYYVKEYDLDAITRVWYMHADHPEATQKNMVMVFDHFAEFFKDAWQDSFSESEVKELNKIMTTSILKLQGDDRFKK